MKRKLSPIALLIVSLILSACAHRSGYSIKDTRLRIIPEGSLPVKTKPREEHLITEKLKKEKEETKIVYSKKTGSISKHYIPGIGSKRKKYNISVSYDNIPLYDLLVNIVKNTLKKNLVVETNLDRTVTVILNGRFSESELLSILKDILQTWGVSMNIYDGVVVVKKARTHPRPSVSSTVGWWVYKPENISPRTALNILREFSGPESTVKMAGSILIVVDYPKNLKRMLHLIKVVDVDPFRGYAVKIFELKNAEPSSVAKEVNNVLKSLRIERGLYQMVPVDRLGYLIAVASSDALMERITSLVKLLDSGEEKSERNIYIYKVQYVKVKKIAETLRELLTGKSAIAPTSSKKKSKKESPAIVSSNVVIVPDETNNALIIEASQEDYKKIKTIISAMDTMPRQVLIEVLIAEVTLNKQLENGVEWWLKAHGNTFTGEAAITYGLAGSRQNLFGFTYYGLNPDNFWNFLYFLSTNTNLTVLSSPHILVRDNEEASIDVGKEVPILSTETVSSVDIQGSAGIDRKIEYRNVGVILKVKPHVSEEGFVTLEISQESSSAEKNTVSGIDSPVILTRKINTTLMVQNEHTIVLGGIIDRRTDTVVKRVPLLGDIPLLGKLFSYESREKNNTELIIMITPHVIDSVSKADVISNIFKTKLRNLLEKKPGER